MRSFPVNSEVKTHYGHCNNPCFGSLTFEALAGSVSKWVIRSPARRPLQNSLISSKYRATAAAPTPAFGRDEDAPTDCHQCS
jgi:hypothetical protein